MPLVYSLSLFSADDIPTGTETVEIESPKTVETQKSPIGLSPAVNQELDQPVEEESEDSQDPDQSKLDKKLPRPPTPRSQSRQLPVPSQPSETVVNSPNQNVGSQSPSQVDNHNKSQDQPQPTENPDPIDDNQLCLAPTEPDINTVPDSTNDSSYSQQCPSNQSIDLDDVPTTTVDTNVPVSYSSLQPPFEDIQLNGALLASRAQFSQLGLKTYNSANPTLVNRQQLNRYCGSFDPSGQQVSGIFGCYVDLGSTTNIYILLTNCRGLNANTARHEMLHEVYSGFGSSKLDRINQLLESYVQNNRSRAYELLEIYSAKSYDVQLAELYAILGSEVADIGIKELENHYRAYFLNREQSINNNDFLGYKRNTLVFLRTESDKLKQISQQLKTLYADLDQRRQSINDLVNGSQMTVDEINALKEEYNLLVQTYEDKRIDYNQQIGQFKQVLDSYNRIIDYGDCRPSN